MDAEHSARSVISRVERALDGITGVQVWSTNLRDWDFPSDLQYLPNLPQTFPDFLAWPPRRAAQLLPSSVSFLPQRILPGPGIDDSHFPIDEVSRCLAAASVPSEERRQFMLELEQDNRFVNTMELDDTRADFGEYAILEYLRCADAYKFPDLARSLAEVFRQGALSSARIQELVHDHERKNGRIWRFVYREGAKMILDYLEAREFATLMARRDVATEATIDGQHVAKFWRWNGFLIRYIEEGRRNGVKHGKPPLLLVHGFGGSSQHFRRSIALLKERYHVFAVDLVGFGRSEKPPTQYTQALWECMLWDFVREVIQTPVYIAGNSIGMFKSNAFKWCQPNQILTFVLFVVSYCICYCVPMKRRIHFLCFCG